MLVLIWDLDSLLFSNTWSFPIIFIAGSEGVKATFEVGWWDLDFTCCYCSVVAISSPTNLPFYILLIYIMSLLLQIFPTILEVVYLGWMGNCELVAFSPYCEGSWLRDLDPNWYLGAFLAVMNSELDLTYFQYLEWFYLGWRVNCESVAFSPTELGCWSYWLIVT